MSSDTVRYDWPKTYGIGPATDFGAPMPIPADARVKAGFLFAPLHIRSYDTALMEQEFRHILWPPCNAQGYSRLAREFAWVCDGRVLHYRIIDVPLTAAGQLAYKNRRLANE